MNYYLAFFAFIYILQLSGIFHILGHFITAKYFNIKTKIKIPIQRLIPIYGWIWTLQNNHEEMSCTYQNNLKNQPSYVRSLIGFAGLYGQMIFMLLIPIIFPNLFNKFISYKNYCLLICFWQFTYLIFYSIWYHDDKLSDFHLLVR